MINLKRVVDKHSLKHKLIGSFILTSIIPILFIDIFTYFNNTNMIRKNVNELTSVNLQKTKNSLDVWLESYSDILFQIYTDDNIVALVNKIDNGEDIAFSRYKLRKTLRGLFYTKEYIKSITIITNNGTVVFYDQLTASTIENSWMNNYSHSKQELYDEISSDNMTHILSTQRATTFASDTYYLFHLGHRIIDYKNVKKKNGIVIVSIDENILKDICNFRSGVKEHIDNLNFIVDDNGAIVSYMNSKQLSKKIYPSYASKKDKMNAYIRFLKKQKVFEGGYITVNATHDDKFDWNIINVSDQSNIISKIAYQQRLLILTLIISFFIITIIILILTKHLTSSIKKVVEAMKKAGKGELSVRAESVKNMPMEIQTIAVQFNSMLDKVQTSIAKEMEANEKLRIAEIKALEAQINPHFLYNTLDTINWMAIDYDEYEISNAINALASILRYGIDNSNGIVTLREEVEWLKQYIYLQQTRLMNMLQCEIHVEPEILNTKIHKLLLQPFVENSILHGFEGVNRQHQLTIDMKEEDGFICISLKDNGKGIDSKKVDDMNHGIFEITGDKNHIGMENAITRIRMYYGENAYIKIESILGEGTTILIKIPKKE